MGLGLRSSLGLVLLGVAHVACGGAADQGVAGTSGGSGGTDPRGDEAGGSSGTGGNSTAGSPSTAGAGAGSNALPEPQHHRPGAIVCDDERPYGEIYSGLGGDCESHADCTNGRNGRCDNTSGSVPYTVCTYDECLKDADCGSGRVCECQGGRGSDFNACVDGNCRIDADCPDSWCSPSPGVCGPSYGTEAYFCRTAKDECSNDSDCGTSNDGEPGFCMYDADVAHWVCMYGQCVG